MKIELDKKQVLMQLQEEGYHNVTPQKLDEFIKDLEKLITYDMKKKKKVTRCREEDTTSSTLPNTTDESVSPSPLPQTSNLHAHRSRYHTHRQVSENKITEGASSSSSECSVGPSRRVLRECTKTTTQESEDKQSVFNEKPLERNRLSVKPSKSCDCVWKRIGCKCCEQNSTRQQPVASAKSKENLAPARPKSSFIRTWQMGSQPRPGSASQKCDPVSLYHQYQQVWKQQKLPGENNHNDLRWTIRERMLGQDPHPRPLSQASSVSSINRQRKRL